MTPPKSYLNEEASRTDAWRVEIADRVGVLEVQNVHIRKAVEENTLICSVVEGKISSVESKVSVIAQDTSEIRDIFQAGKGTVKVLKVIGEVAKWLTVVAVVIMASIVWLKGGIK